MKPDGRLESHYQLLGLVEGLIIPSFTQDHFKLNDFTPFHDEIRKVDSNLLVGRYVTGILPDLSGILGGADLGILHSTPGSRELGCYYTLTNAGISALPTELLLRPFLDVNLPDGLGLTFDEQMETQMPTKLMQPTEHPAPSAMELGGDLGGGGLERGRHFVRVPGLLSVFVIVQILDQALDGELDPFEMGRRQCPSFDVDDGEPQALQRYLVIVGR